MTAEAFLEEIRNFVGIEEGGLLYNAIMAGGCLIKSVGAEKF